MPSLYQVLFYALFNMILFHPDNENDTSGPLPHCFPTRILILYKSAALSHRAMCFRGSDPLHFHLVGQGLYDSPWQVLVQEWVSDQFWPMRYKGKSKEKLWGKCFHGKPSHVKSSCLFFLLIFSCLDAMPRIAAAIMPSWSHWVVICT